jgi:aspartate kinase
MTHSKPQIGGLIQRDRLAMIGIMDIPSRPGVSGRLFSALSDQGINVEFIVHLIDMEEKDHIVLCVDCDVMDQTLVLVEGLREELGGEAITTNPDVALVRLFGFDLREHRGIASHMFQTLGDCGINIRAISTSLSTISCLIESQRLNEAVQALRNAFTLP